MAGHSHSANIAHRKGLVDAKRAKLFTKLCRAVYVAARTAVATPPRTCGFASRSTRHARTASPRTTSSARSRRGPARLGGENFEEVVYEGYGPGGVAVLCEALTDNRNRTASELRRVFELAGGNLGAMGCVGYLFTLQGLVRRGFQARDRGPLDGGRARGRRRRRRSWSTVITRSPATPSFSKPYANRSRNSGFPPSPPRPVTSRVTTSTLMSKAAGRCASSGICSTKTTTSRTFTPTTISPKRRSPPDPEDLGLPTRAHELISLYVDS